MACPMSVKILHVKNKTKQTVGEQRDWCCEVLVKGVICKVMNGN